MYSKFPHNLGSVKNSGKLIVVTIGLTEAFTLTVYKILELHLIDAVTEVLVKYRYFLRPARKHDQ